MITGSRSAHQRAVNFYRTNDIANPGRSVWKREIQIMFWNFFRDILNDQDGSATAPETLINLTTFNCSTPIHG